jgi:hypothetical protein
MALALVSRGGNAQGVSRTLVLALGLVVLVAASLGLAITKLWPDTHVGPQGLSQEIAVIAARRVVGPEARLISAQAGPAAEVPGAPVLRESPNRLIWAIQFERKIVVTPPTGAPGSPELARTLVVLDFYTGEFITALTDTIAGSD